MGFSAVFSGLFATFRRAPGSFRNAGNRDRKKGSFGKGVFSKKVHFLEILEILENLEILEILEILENPQTVGNKGESDHFLEIQENLEILEIPPVKRPLS